MVWFTILGLIVVGVFAILNIAKYRKQEKASMKNVNPVNARPDLSLNEAKQLVQTAVDRNSLRVSSEKMLPNEVLEQLGEVSRDFFSKYPDIRTNSGGTVLGVNLIAPSSYMVGLISIGHSEDWDVVQKKNDDRVFVIEGGEANQDDIESYFPSVYHFLADEIKAR